MRAWRAGGEERIKLIEGDFLTANTGPIEAAIANPPYNRFQNRDIPTRVQHELRALLGEFASGYTNQYALFLYLVISRLTRHGRAAFIVPSEFLATGYGVQIKRFLARTRRLKHLILFDTQTRIFADAATTACVLLFQGEALSELAVWRLSGIDDSDRLHAICTDEVHDADAHLAYEELDVHANWQNLDAADTRLQGFVSLGTFGRAKRGIATGANEFFILNADEVYERSLDCNDWLPCIPSADSAPHPVFDMKDWNALLASGRAACLFDGMSGSLAARSYVKYGERQGFHLRYLTRTRSPWYRLEQREIARLLLAVFGRGGFRAVLNRSDAINLTAFHGFYPLPAWRSLIEPLWLYLQTPLALRAFAHQQRSYGDGLKKLEPGDWNKLLTPDWRNWSDEALMQARELAAKAVRAAQDHNATCWSACLADFERMIEEKGRAQTSSVETLLQLELL